MKGYKFIATDSASCLSQICTQIVNPMRMSTHLHAELIQKIANIIEHSLCPIYLYKVNAHSGIVGNEGADACARTAAYKDTTDIALPDAEDPFYNSFWLASALPVAHALNPQQTHATSPFYLTNLREKLKAHIHERLGPGIYRYIEQLYTGIYRYIPLYRYTGV